MIIILSGEDTYRSRKRLQTLIEAFKKKFDPHGYNVSFFEGANPPFEAVQSASGSISFMGNKRLLVFENFFGAKTTEQQKRILSFLEDRDTDAQVVLFWQRGELPGASGRLSFVKKAKSEAFPVLIGSALERWIRKAVEDRGASIEPQAISLLAGRIGGDLWKMENTIDQLKSRAHAKTGITIHDVQMFTDSVLDDNIFHLTDALGHKSAKEALELFFDQLQSGAHPLYVLTMLLRHFRILIQVSGSGSAATAGELGIHPFAFQKAQSQCRLFQFEELKDAFIELQRIEAELKLGAKDPETLFSRFIFRVTKR